MAKYGQADRAYQLYEEARQKQFLLNTDTYNAIIKSSVTLKENNQKRLDFVLKVLEELNAADLKPNIRTLNVVMDVLAMSKSDRLCRWYMLKFLMEFKQLGIEPSLGTFYSLLTAFYREGCDGLFCCKNLNVSEKILGSQPTSLLYEIMDEIDNKEFKVQDVRDTNFFVTAMDICNTHLRDRDLAERINNLLHYGNNFDLIGDSYKESVYQYVAIKIFLTLIKKLFTVAITSLYSLLLHLSTNS